MDSLDRAAEALVAMTATMCTGVAQAWSRWDDGAGTMFSGVPVATLNTVYAARRGAVEPVTRLLDEVAATGMPYSLQVRPGDVAVAAYAKERGMAESEEAPLMLLTERPDVPRMSIRRLGADGMDEHLDLMARGFGMPPEVLAPLRGSPLFDDPAMLAYVAEEDGVPVSTAVGVLAQGHVGIFNVATPEEHQRRGYGGALTARAVCDGFDAGATTALLQSSEMGYPVYERLGFREVERWTVWVSEAPA